jgi:Fe(II)/alpha-ketoglutarate-dependent arginine beta-hydroxylase
MDSIELHAGELDEIAKLVDRVSRGLTAVDDPRLLAEATVLAHEMPARVRAFVNAFRRDETGYCLIRGHQVSDDAIGRTPRHWQDDDIDARTLKEEVLLLLYGSLLGDVFGWATQQNGRLIHDVFPIEGHQQEQLGTGSEVLLTWHTEDAFHPYRADYLILACLRNPYAASTTVANVDDLQLSPHDIDVLFQNRFIIRPDESHLAKNNTTSDIDFSVIEAMAAAPPPVAVLFGNRQRPYLRADPYFMEIPRGDDEAREVFDRFVAAVDAHLVDVVLQPGDFCFIDNYKVVHGRRPFKARFDGTDRWLKRACITRDLRKSREMRSTMLSQIIG